MQLGANNSPTQSHTLWPTRTLPGVESVHLFTILQALCSRVRDLSFREQSEHVTEASGSAKCAQHTYVLRRSARHVGCIHPTCRRGSAVPEVLTYPIWYTWEPLDCDKFNPCLEGYLCFSDMVRYDKKNGAQGAIAGNFKKIINQGGRDFYKSFSEICD